jgi:hypothetical protein
MAGDDDTRVPPTNPYGGRPGGGISLPEYFKPTPGITGSRANYFRCRRRWGGMRCGCRSWVVRRGRLVVIRPGRRS